MSFEIELFAHETTDTSLQIEVCQWCVSLSWLEIDSAEQYYSKKLDTNINVTI